MGWVKSVKGKTNLLLMVIGEMIFISAKLEITSCKKNSVKISWEHFLISGSVWILLSRGARISGRSRDIWYVIWFNYIYILKAYIELNETYRLAVGKDGLLEFTFEQQFKQLALLKRWSYSARLSLAIVNKYTFTCWFACSYHRHHQRKT